MMNLTEKLTTEIDEYNTIIQQINDLETQKIHKLGRISILQEQVQSEKNEPVEDSDSPVEA